MRPRSSCWVGRRGISREGRRQKRTRGSDFEKRGTMFYHDLPEEITSWRVVWHRLGLGPQINGHPLIVLQAAQLLLGRAEYAAAEQAFREVIARVPDHLPSLRWLDILVQRQGRMEEYASLRERTKKLEASAAEPSPSPDVTLP